MNKRRLIARFCDDFEKAIGHRRVRRGSIEREVHEVNAGSFGGRRFRIDISAFFGVQPEVDNGREPHLLDPGYCGWRDGAGARDGCLHLGEVGDPLDGRFLDLGLPDGNGSAERDDGRDDGKAKLFHGFSRQNETTRARMNIRALARD
jgi:hypothetical protein